MEDYESTQLEKQQPRTGTSSKVLYSGIAVAMGTLLTFAGYKFSRQ